MENKKQKKKKQEAQEQNCSFDIMENKKQKKENKAKEQNKRQKNKITLGKQEAKEQYFSWKTGDKRTIFLLENKKQENKIQLHVSYVLQTGKTTTSRRTQESERLASLNIMGFQL